MSDIRMGITADQGRSQGRSGGGRPPHTGKNYIRHWKKQGKFKGKGEKSGENEKIQRINRKN